MTDDELVESITGITPTEALVLLALWRSDGKWITQDRIAFVAWPDDYHGAIDKWWRHTIAVHMSRLRVKIASHGWRIESWPSFGKYRLMRQPDVEQVA